MKNTLLGYGVPQHVLDDLIIVQKLKEPEIWPPAADMLTVMILDTETTGVDTERDEVIELGYVLVQFSKTAELGDVIKTFNQLQQPELPIKNSNIHGIYDEDCMGHVIAWDEVAEDLKETHLVVAHNSGFDRRMVERYCPEFKDVAWSCTFKDPDYSKRKINSHKLDYLCYLAGYHYEAHRALIDVYATLAVIRSLGLFEELVIAAKSTTYVVHAGQAPFSAKDKLKENKYKPLYVNGKFKSWYTTCLDEELEQVVWWLKHEIGVRPHPNWP